MVDVAAASRMRARPRTTPAVRSGDALPTPHDRRRYALVLGALIVLALGFTAATLAWENPLPVGTRGFWLIAKLRATSLVVMLVVALCQAVATVAFQTVTTNRILTPSIMGFESLYTAIQTGAVYLLGAGGVMAVQGSWQFLGQVLAMVGLSVLLYGWLLSGRYANLQIMLLIGLVLGGGLGAVSTFMQRMLSPSEFDVLTARLFGSVTSADAGLLPIALPLVVAASGFLWWNARRLNVLALGRDISVNLGLDHRRQLIMNLVAVSVLISVSTALVGPMTFFGFLVATLAYQFASCSDHRRVFPVAVLLGFVVLSGAYFVLQRIFYAQGVVSVIIELVGGSVFLLVILRKGTL